RTSRRNRRSSSRSAVVRPPSPAPISRAACLIQVPIVMAEGPNSLDRDAAVRPDRASATICRLNSGVYRTVLSAIVNSSCYNGEVSTKAGQLHIVFVVLMIVAFTPSYFKPVVEGTFQGASILHLHGALFFAWPVLFSAQTLLATGGRLNAHRSLGLL